MKTYSHLTFKPALLLLAVVLATSIGCGGKDYKLAEVSGTLTLDGNPVSGVKVTFMPIATDDNTAPGPHSSATTDAQGKFVLTCRDGDPGAVVGKHNIGFGSADSERGFSEEDIAVAKETLEEAKGTGDAEAIKAAKAAWDKVSGAKANPLPDKYRKTGVVTFDVPEGGSDSANLELTTK